MATNQNIPNDSLDNEGEENIRKENELLRIKLKAELGGDSYSTGNLDPILENEFLKQVLVFENNYANTKCVKLFDLLGKPNFKRSSELADNEVNSALNKITALLSQKNIDVNFEGVYNDRVKYTFITEELFDHKTNDFGLPGMTTHFSYEEFHPNHKLDIENRALEFLSEWFEQKVDEKSWYLADDFILPDKRILSKNEVARKAKVIFDSYDDFTDCEYTINDINFELQEAGGMGYAEGLVRYTAVLENHEQVAFKGPFKLYLSLEYGWWSIFHIVFPGFEY